LHLADKEQCPIPLELSKFVEAIIVIEYPKQHVIKPFLLKGRILEYLDEKKRKAAPTYGLSEGKEYYFLQKYAYHLLIKLEPLLLPVSRESLPVFVQAFNMELKLYQLKLAFMLDKAVKHHPLSDREKMLYECVLRPAIYERDGVEAHIRHCNNGGIAEGLFKKNPEEEEGL
jgi:hypothetical protein